MRVLFLVKKRADYCHEYGDGYSYCDALGGLYNSARFVVQMLVAHGVSASIVQVTDNNDIDREVTKFKPHVVIIEALWVVPSKFAVLTKLHPSVKWIVRVHSEIPFLAVEGVAIEWISAYLTHKNVYVASNSTRATMDLDSRFGGKIIYLPNWYPIEPFTPPVKDPSKLNIACFGAIRPLKNQLIQAMAAMAFANYRRQKLRFHINATRCEQSGDNVLRNIRALFAGTQHTLVEHDWESHADFLKTISKMDVAMAVSFSETFNITAADAVVTHVPLVASSEVTWASSDSFAPATGMAGIVAALTKVTGRKKHKIIKENLKNLAIFNKVSAKAWLGYLKA